MTMHTFSLDDLTVLRNGQVFKNSHQHQYLNHSVAH